MTLQQRIDRHDKEIAELRASELRTAHNLERLEKAMMDLVNQQGETKRVVERLAQTVDRFIQGLRGANGHKKR